MPAELLAVRMRSDERTAVHYTRDVPESGLVEVRCIHDHLLVDHMENSLLAEVAQSFSASGCCAVTEAVFFVPCQHAVPCAEVIVLVEFCEGRIIRSICHSLNADHYIENSVFPGLHHLIVRLYDPEVLCLCDLVRNAGEKLLSSFCIVPGVRRIYPQNEDRTFDSALLQPSKVMVVKDIGLALHSFDSNICPDVAVCIKTLHINLLSLNA